MQARELTSQEVREGEQNISERDLNATQIQALVRRMDQSKQRWKRMKRNKVEYEEKLKNENTELYFNYQSLFQMHAEDRLDSTFLPNLDIIEQTNTLIQARENSTYFLDFYLNFGDNELALANNIILDDEDPNNPTILIKLYEPLSDSFDLNSQLWVITSVEESRAYQVTFEEIPIIIIDKKHFCRLYKFVILS